MQIILDMSSGNTCKNDKAIVKRMIDAINEIDTNKHEIIFKWQLALDDGINIPLDHDVFDCAYWYAASLGYKTTSSVADLESLKFLLQYDVCFVKIPNDRALDWLIGEIPRKIPIYVSISISRMWTNNFAKQINLGIIQGMQCVSKYPATIDEYDKLNIHLKTCSISDHTVGLDLFKKYQPRIWEKHYKLSDSTGLDAGPFAITPEELREIL
ncbi:MAG: N-acetylneuraminate synthase family protein [Candidatus Babeliales bacterium]